MTSMRVTHKTLALIFVVLFCAFGSVAAQDQEGTQSGTGSFLETLSTSDSEGVSTEPDTAVAMPGAEAELDANGQKVKAPKPAFDAKAVLEALLEITRFKAANPGKTKIAAAFGERIMQIIRTVISWIRNIIDAIFGGGGWDGGGGGDDGGDFGGGNDGGTTGGDGGTTVTPGTPAPPVPDGTVPTGVDALKSAIKSKFGTTMAGNWSEKSLRAVFKTLSVLPENFRKANRYMERCGNRGGLLGMGEVGGGKIWIYGGAFNMDGGTGIGTIVHEIGHNFHGRSNILSGWRQVARGGSVSSYGNTNSAEDFCESVRVYFINGARMKQTHPSRYNFIKDKVMGGREFTGNEYK